ncbi:MAG TPA: hypothetical protein ENO24_10190 [Chloroflexi bacterium]|nr:hypothetical protein [Chloroflexota bacterium]
MAQIHKRFTDEQVVFLLQKYSQGLISRAEAQEVSGIGKAPVFAPWSEYGQDPQAYTVSCGRLHHVRTAF